MAAYVELRASGGSLDDSFARRFRNEISTFTASLCDQIKALGEKAGSGDTRSSRLDDVPVSPGLGLAPESESFEIPPPHAADPIRAIATIQTVTLDFSKGKTLLQVL